jgi:hypothetical protein
MRAFRVVVIHRFLTKWIGFLFSLRLLFTTRYALDIMVFQTNYGLYDGDYRKSII